MKYAFMSDIHSNPAALKAALDDARALGCGRHAFLGDVTGYGYDVLGALKMVRENFNIFILGNPRYDLCTTYAIYDTASQEVTIRRLPFDFKGYIMSMLAAKVPLPDWVMLLLSRARSMV